MLEELFKAIGQQAVKAAGPQTIKPGSEPAHVYYLQGKDGTLERREADPDPRSHKASDLATVAAFATDHDDAVVWYSRAGIVCLIDNATRRDRITLPLTYSTPLLQLQAFDKQRTSLKQRELILMLRTTFAGCLGLAGNLIDILRGIKFSTLAAGESVVQHGRSSVGKQLESQLSGTGAVPESISLAVPVFLNLRSGMQTIAIAIEVDAPNECFQLIPLAGEIEKAIQGAEEHIHGQLVELLGDKAPTYYGTP